MIKISSASGIFEDSWLRPTASIDLLSDKPIFLYLFLPFIDKKNYKKNLVIYSNSKEETINIVRGEVFIAGPFEPVDGALAINFSCETAEPVAAADCRSLGVMLVKVQSFDGQESLGGSEIYDCAAAISSARVGAAKFDVTMAKGEEAFPYGTEAAPIAASRHPDIWAITDYFDAEFYRAGFASGTCPSDLESHYLAHGWKEGRDPAPWFSTRHYLALHSDVADAGMNPFVHYCTTGRRERRTLIGLGHASERDVYKAQEYAVSRGPNFEEWDPSIGVGRRKRAKVLAYYLPQFHSVPENDLNWGRGFTEWTNLPRGTARFMGHIQPRIPRDLGHYSLTDGDTMRRQIDMARAAGLHGFCFYHYWFDGKRVLDAPMERLLADPTLDFPFCLMWANENWTRTWDGSDSETILKQNYRPEDEVKFADDVARHMKDSRYIRIDDRPLFYIYRPGELPDAKNYVKRLRKLFKKRHNLEPLLFQVQGFGDDDPRVFGLDGAIEFPPHKIQSVVPDVKGDYDILDDSFSGYIYEYSDVVNVATNSEVPEFPLIRTVFPSWDNEARRPGRSTIFANSTPELFSKWLDWAITQADKNPVFGEPIVCINAWNEWAEGAYLEPDVHFGGAYLNSVARIVHGVPVGLTKGSPQKVLLVGHDVVAFGAQRLLANIGRTLKCDFGCEVTFVLLDGKDFDAVTIIDDYKSVGKCFFASGGSVEQKKIFASLFKSGYRHAITNTTVTGSSVIDLSDAGFRVISLIHELPNLLKSYNLLDQATAIAARSDLVIFPAPIVQAGFEAFAGPISNKAEILPQGLYNTDVLNQPIGDNGLRAEFGLSSTCLIVLGVGYADMRKGIDRFISAALTVCDQHDDIAFIWVGAPSLESKTWLQPEIDAANLGGRVRILEQRDDVARFFAAANLYYLSSREDPFPSVVLEALACGLPLIGHEGSGGCDGLIRRHGRLIPAHNPLSAAAAIVELLDSPSDGPSIAAARRAEVAINYRFDQYVFELLQRLNRDIVSLTAIVPNYNYEKYITPRLRAVFDQSYPLREIIVLDDASSDDSVSVIREAASSIGRSIKLLVNDRNSGSPFAQWRKGVEMACGEYVWIAEADDLSAPDFVERIVSMMVQTGSAIGFCDSQAIDGNDEQLGDSYRPYLNEIEPGAFDRAFVMEGAEFLRRFLTVKNVILNVSGAVFRRDALIAALEMVGEELFEFSVAGDWRLYAEICAQGGRVAYLPDALNTHRRHGTSVTHALKVDKHLEEIGTMHCVATLMVGTSDEIRRKQQAHMTACRIHLDVEQI